ncbi:unnamed protein product [Parascedosporium putredinis]|uniref:Gas1-like protein n=1 Tax=Parascedosporium putredinis TaxID=1442378 RepID=A0A9P1H1A4_9PEZI|nr:unnamed protein product [Parascedosporium putredinis]CAI7992553.1 unnamed protein product [Parascedosporium putredinis]
MVSIAEFFVASALLGLAHGHGVLINAQGDAGSPASVGFKVNPEIARNCTTINPCQQDSTLIRDAEIEANLVNECGRTELTGNIDIGEETENALAAGAVTQVQKGSTIEVTIHQVNADGAGPYSCDLDVTSNASRLTGQIPLNVTNNVPGVNGFSQAKAQDFVMTVQLPADFQCTGASTGNICTVRCRNNALAGPFGGCFAVQQTDVEATANTPQNIKTAQGLEATLAQVLSNQQDLPAAVQANANAGADSAQQNLAAVEAILKISPTTTAFPQQTLPLPEVPADNAAVTSTTAAAEATEGLARLADGIGATQTEMRSERLPV